jgi:hypothetical protein
MSEPVTTWDDFVDRVRSLVAGRPIQVWVGQSMVNLSADATDATGQWMALSAGLQDFGDGMVRVITGWFTAVSGEYTAGPGQTSHAIHVLAAVLDGNVEESAHLDPQGALVGLSSRVWHAAGEDGTAHGRTDGTEPHVRRLPRWP